MLRFRWEPFAVALLLALAVSANAQAQYAYGQPYYGYSGYGYSQPYSGMAYTPAYTYRLSPTTSYSYNYAQPSRLTYSQPYYSGYSAYPTYTTPYYSYSSSRVYPPANQGIYRESGASMTYFPRSTYSRGYTFTQPYYYAGQGYGTMTQGMTPSGVSYRQWQAPSMIR